MSTAIDRRRAVLAGDSMRLAVRGRRWVSGRLVSQAADYIVLSPGVDSLERILVPSPRNFHNARSAALPCASIGPEPLGRELSWNSLLRRLIGHELSIEINGGESCRLSTLGGPRSHIDRCGERFTHLHVVIHRRGAFRLPSVLVVFIHFLLGIP